MIEINLLPESLREVEHTPWPRLITILVGLIIFLTTGFFAANEYLKVITDLKDKKNDIEAFLASEPTKNGLIRVTKLENEIQELKKRKDILTAIVASKIMWSKKLDEFNSLVHKNYPNTLWFDSIDINSTQKIDFSKSNSPIVMRMSARGHLVLGKEESIGASVSKLQTQLRTPENDFGKNIDQKKFKIGSWASNDSKELNKVVIDFPMEVYFLPKTFLSTEAPKVKKP